MRLNIPLIPILLVFPYMALATGPWTNEPAGSHSFVDCPFNSLGECQITGGGPAIVSDATAPISPSSVAKSTLAAGANTGGAEIHYLTPQMNRELFVGLMWRTNSQFYGRQVANKMFFIRGPVSNGFFGMFGGPAGVSPFRISWCHNSGNIDNSHTCGDGGFQCYPNGAGNVSPGVWTKIEAYVKASTTDTSRDGIVRWWINGVAAGDYRNMNVSSRGLNEWVWSETWDGTVNPVPAVEWNHFIDHLYISAPNFVLSTPKITTSTIASTAQSGTRYNAYLSASEGYVPYTWKISAGSLPGGMVLGEKNGVISGTPTTCGLHNFTVKVSDANQSVATKNFSINVTGTCTGSLVTGNISNSVNETFAVRATSGAVVFKLPFLKQSQCLLNVYNLSGKKLFSKRATAKGQREISLSRKLHNGVYVAELITGNKRHVLRFSVLN